MAIHANGFEKFIFRNFVSSFSSKINLLGMIIDGCFGI